MHFAHVVVLQDQSTQRTVPFLSKLTEVGHRNRTETERLDPVTLLLTSGQGNTKMSCCSCNQAKKLIQCYLFKSQLGIQSDCSLFFQISAFYQGNVLVTSLAEGISSYQNLISERFGSYGRELGGKTRVLKYSKT